MTPSSFFFKNICRIVLLVALYLYVWLKFRNPTNKNVTRNIYDRQIQLTRFRPFALLVTNSRIMDRMKVNRIAINSCKRNNVKEL